MCALSHSTAEQGWCGQDTGVPTLQPDADEALLTAQLKLQLYRIYTSVSRQRGWFKLHETNARALAEVVEALRVRFFPHESSILDVLNVADHTENTDSSFFPFGGEMMRAPAAPTDTTSSVQLRDEDGTTTICGDAVVPAAMQRIVPAYLLQLTPRWIHERLGGAGREAASREEAGEALVALLLPLLRSLSGVVEMRRQCADASASLTTVYTNGMITVTALCVTARHLFYLLHEALSCLSSWKTKTLPNAGKKMISQPLQLSSAEQMEAKQILARLLDVRECGRLTQLHLLLCADEAGVDINHHNPPTVAAVSQSSVSEALGFLATHYLGMDLLV